jgi:hypothetical protein
MSAVHAFCRRCGINLAPESRFCEACGKPVDDHAAGASPAPASAAVAAGVRGTVLRDTNAGPGLLSVDGRQLVFTLEQHWRGATAPTVNAAVEVVLDAGGAVASVTPASTQLISPQQLADLNALKDAYLPKLLAQVERAGKPLLAAVAVVAVAWIWLPAMSVQIMAGMSQHVTMFDLLRLANVGASLDSFGQQGGSSGLYGLLCVLAMLAPLAHVFLRQRWARFGLFAPLAFMVATGLGIYLKIHNMASAATEGARSFGGSQAGDLAAAMMNQIMAALSVGYGSYLALAAALYLAWLGVQQVLTTRH